MSGNCKCPVCNLEIINNQCPTCRRDFFPMNQDAVNFKTLNNYDIETVSTETGEANPVLLCSTEDVHQLNKTEREKENDNDYLRKHFPNAEITTEYYYPA